jgi:hypothetical protein
MEIIQYVKWTKPGERELLNSIIEKGLPRFEFCKEVSKAFNINNAEAAIVYSRFKNLIEENQK